MSGSDGAWLIVGLGNPGPRYAAHRHNVGHMVLDVLAERVRASGHGAAGSRGGRGRRAPVELGWRVHPRGRAEVVEGRFSPSPSAPDPLLGARVVLAKPRSYMNESGGPVAGLATFYKLPPHRLVVVHDELDIPYGTLRLKLGGGDNGHNGLRSIRRSIATGDYYRVRFGVGRPPGSQDPADYVLSPFSTAEGKDLDFFLDRAADAVEALVTEGLERAQNRYHGSTPA